MSGAARAHGAAGHARPGPALVRRLWIWVLLFAPLAATLYAAAVDAQ